MHERNNMAIWKERTGTGVLRKPKRVRTWEKEHLCVRQVDVEGTQKKRQNKIMNL
jgi:hypothetical protein